MEKSGVMTAWTWYCYVAIHLMTLTVRQCTVHFLFRATTTKEEVNAECSKRMTGPRLRPKSSPFVRSFGFFPPLSLSASQGQPVFSPSFSFGLPKILVVVHHQKERVSVERPLPNVDLSLSALFHETNGNEEFWKVYVVFTFYVSSYVPWFHSVGGTTTWIVC